MPTDTCDTNPNDAHDPEQAPDYEPTSAEQDVSAQVIADALTKLFRLSEKGVAALRVATELCLRYEGVHDSNPDTAALEPEADLAGYLSLGYGRLLRDPDTGSPLRDTVNGWRLARRQYPEGITKTHARFLLSSDLLDVLQQLSSRLDFDGLTPEQLGAIMSFVYNLGIVAFTGSTLLQKIAQHGAQGPFDLEFSFSGLYSDVSRKVPLTTFALAWTAWSRYTTDRGLRVVSGGLFTRRYAEFLLFSKTFETAPEAIEIADEEYRDLV